MDDTSGIGRRGALRWLLGVGAALALTGSSTALAADAPDIAPERDAWRLDWRPVQPLARMLDVPPYRTQLDGSRFAGSNCGPAVLGMALSGYGVDCSTLELRRLSHTYQDNWPNGGGTFLQHLARVASDYGLAAHGLYHLPAGRFHSWTVDELAAELDRGRWAIPLVQYALLPGHAGGVRTGHYILLYGLEDDGFRYHDPAFRPLAAGAGRWISAGQLAEAMVPVQVRRQAVTLGA